MGGCGGNTTNICGMTGGTHTVTIDDILRTHMSEDRIQDDLDCLQSACHKLSLEKRNLIKRVNLLERKLSVLVELLDGVQPRFGWVKKKNGFSS